MSSYTPQHKAYYEANKDFIQRKYGRHKRKYNKEYYKLNADEIRAKRRERYRAKKEAEKKALFEALINKTDESGTYGVKTDSEALLNTLKDTSENTNEIKGLEESFEETEEST